MRTTLNVPNRNNFDLVRFCLAMTVCLVHARALSTAPALAIIPLVLNSEVAVEGFFAVSGFLIVMSYERSNSLASYAGKRARRLVPAYMTVILLSAIVLRTISTAPQFYFTPDWWAYLAANLSYLNFVHPGLPGVFQNNVEHAVNGALWTLKIEIAFYVVVPLLVTAIRRFGAAPVIVGTYLLSSFCAMRAHGALAHQLPAELRYFMAGTACFYGWPVLQRRWKTLAAMAVAVFIASKFLPLGLLVPAAIGLLTICAGMFCYLGDFGRHGDFSYGVYILHFPIIQTLVQAGAFERSTWLALVGAVVLAVLGAVVLWHTIESRFLHRHGSVAEAKRQSAQSAAESAG